MSYNSDQAKLRVWLLKQGGFYSTPKIPSATPYWTSTSLVKQDNQDKREIRKKRKIISYQSLIAELLPKKYVPINH
jgi:hypothetical protein